MKVYIVTAEANRVPSHADGEWFHILGVYYNKEDADAVYWDAIKSGKWGEHDGDGNEPLFDSDWQVNIYEEGLIGLNGPQGLALTNEMASEVYDLLVARAGASENKREEFVHYVTTDGPHQYEFRFQGDFGFGGKIYIDWSYWRIDCYHEDRTPELNETRDEVNRILRLIRLQELS